MLSKVIADLHQAISRLCWGEPFAEQDQSAMEEALTALKSFQADHYVATPDDPEDWKRAGNADWIDVTRAVRIHLIGMPTERGPRGWLSTYGMQELGYAELEIRDVPMFMFEAGVRLLNSVCSYIVNGDKPVLEGQVIQEGSRLCIFQFRQLEPISADQAEHYEHPRWCLVDPPGIENRCDVCSGKVPRA